MSDRYQELYFGIIKLSSTLFFLALTTKYSYEERNHDTRSSWTIFIFNAIAFIGHMDFFITGRIFFMRSIDNDGIKWLSLAMAVFHGVLMLLPIHQRRWFIFKNFDPRL